MTIDLTVQKDNNKSISLLFIIYALITSAVYILPVAKLSIPYVFAGTLMLLSVVFFAFVKSDWFEVAFWLCFASLLQFALGTLISGVAVGESINEFIRNVRFFVPALWGVFALRYSTLKQKKLFLFLFAILLLYILLNTTAALKENPMIARELAQNKQDSSSEINAFRRNNVGGFEFSYMMGIVTLCLAEVALKAKKLLVRLLSAMAAFFCFSYIIQTMYTTLLVLTFIGVVVLIFFNFKSPLSKFLLIIAALVILFFIGDIFALLGEVFPSESVLHEKFVNLSRAVSEKDATITGSRPERIAASLENFVQHPVFGRYDLSSSPHSTVFGCLETYGIVGFGLLVFVFVKMTRTVLGGIKDIGGDRKLFYTVLIYLIALAFLNPVNYVFELTIAAFFIVPMVCEFIGEQKAVEEEEQ